MKNTFLKIIAIICIVRIKICQEILTPSQLSINPTNTNITDIILPASSIKNSTENSTVLNVDSTVNSTFIESINNSTGIDNTVISSPNNVSENIVISSESFIPKDTPNLITQLQALNGTEKCITRLSKLLSYMSDAEQIAFLNAFKSMKVGGNSIENTGRCFAPGYLKKIFLKIVKGSLGKISESLTSKSRQIRNSFSCYKTAFEKLKSKGNYNKAVLKAVNAQAESNKCLSSFLKDLNEVLSARRRYFLLNINDINNTGISQNDTIVGFPWLEDEMNIITPSFLKFANCFQSFPDSLISSYSEIQSVLSQDSSCAMASQNLTSSSSFNRLLEKNDKDNTKNETDTKSNSNSKNDNTIIVSTKSQNNEEKYNGNSKSEDTIKNNGKYEESSKNSTNIKGNGKADSDINQTNGNTKSEDENKGNSKSNKTDKITDKSQENKSSIKSELKNNVKQIKIQKQSIAFVAFSQTGLSIMNNIISNYQNQKNDQYRYIAGNLLIIRNSTTLNSKCNFVSQVIETIKDKSSKSLLNSEISKAKDNVACQKENYAISVSIEPNSTIAKLICTDAEISCVNSNINLEKTASKTLFISGCSNFIRYSYSYSTSLIFGDYFDFVTKDFKSCQSASASKCAQAMKNKGKKKTLKFLQDTTSNNSVDNSTNKNDSEFTIISTMTDNSMENITIVEPISECTVSIQQQCSDILDDACSSSNLYNYIGQLSPSSSASPVPDACKNIDATNPNFIECFKWINKNLLLFSMFPNMTSILNIQQTITNSQVATVENPINSNSTITPIQTINSTVSTDANISSNLTIANRLLQFNTNEIIILKSDASTGDLIANIPKESYSIQESEIQIDGSTPLSSADATVQAEIVSQGNIVPLTGEITPQNLKTGSTFTKLIFPSIFLIIFVYLN